MAKSPDPHLPQSSMNLLVPPLRLMSACMWQVAQEQNVDQYEKVAEFITLVTEMVPELMNYRLKSQLILGLRARRILELLNRMDTVDCKAIQDHLNSFQQKTTNYKPEEDQDGAVEISKSAFVELVQSLVRNQSEKESFFKEVFPVQYGVGFNTALQILVWDFLYRLENFLPVPSFSQVFSMFDLSSFDYKLEQFVSDSEDVKKILQHQQEHQKMTKIEFTFMPDTILSALTSKRTTEASEDHSGLKINREGKDIKQDKEKLNQENSCRMEDMCEDDEEINDTSSEVNPYSRPLDCGLSPLTSSPCSEEDEAASDIAPGPCSCIHAHTQGRGLISKQLVQPPSSNPDVHKSQ
ncbi:hypothetical protein PAMP_015018 [Pampus punctatissimus]